MRTEAPLLAPVFRSDAQARLLSTVLLAEDAMSVSEIATAANLSYPTAHREVDRLLQAGILTQVRAGRTRLIQADETSPLVAPLRQIVLVATGAVVLLKQQLLKVPKLESAFLYGSFAARATGIQGAAPQDIDLMVIGDVDASEVYEICEDVEGRVGRPVNPTILTAQEFAAGSGFITSIRDNPVVELVGDLPWQ